MTPLTNQSRLFKTADLLLLLIVLPLIVSLYIHAWSDGPARLAAIRDHDGKTRQVSLHKKQTLVVAGRLGTSTLQVDDGRIRFIDSPCTKKICIHSGWLKHNGEVTACLPNRVSIRLAGIEPGFDSINF